MKINEGYSAGVGNFLGHLDTTMVESVEILRGPQSALYGSDTTAGVMSFETLSGKSGIEFNIGGEAGSLGWKKGYGAVRGGTETWDYAVGAAYLDSDGVHDNEYYDNLTVNFKTGAHLGILDAELAYIYIDSEFQAAELNETNSFLSSLDENWAFQTPDPNNANEYDHHIATLKLSHDIMESLRHKVVFGWFKKEHYRNDLDDGLLGYETAPFDDFSFDSVNYNRGDAVPIYDDGNGVAYGYDHKNLMADYNLIWDSQLADFGQNSILFGFEYMYQEGGKWGRYGDLKADTDNYSFYVNDQLLLLEDALILSAGPRWDDHSEFDNDTTGKVGAAYTFHNWGSTLFTNYGTSFRAPSFFNLFDAVYGNKDLTPETGWTVEVGLRQDMLDGRFNAEITYWNSKLDNVIVFDYTIPNPASSVGSGKYANRDSQETRGVEIVLGYDFTEQLNLSANYTYTHSVSEEDGEYFCTVQIARNKGNLILTYKIDDYNVGLSGYYSGPRLRWKGDVEMDEYFRLDCFARYNLMDTVSMYTRVENLLDADIEEGLGYEQPGFYGVIGLELKI